MFITDEEFRLFRTLIYDEAGIYLKETRKDYLENRLQKRMTATSTASPFWYYKHVLENRKTELITLLDELTVNETSFFRNRPQIDLFGKGILPEILAKKEREKDYKLRIWSAGCSTGEEPYTIGILLNEAINGIGAWDIKIIASDLSLSVLSQAAKGEYDEEKVSSTVDDPYISKYFLKGGNKYHIKDEVKKLVVFDFHNLKNDNGLDGLDAIFCRNVMIYFDMEEQKRLAGKFYRSLRPGGYLLIGHAESLQGMDTGFKFVYDNKGTAYKKPDEEELA